MKICTFSFFLLSVKEILLQFVAKDILFQKRKTFLSHLFELAFTPCRNSHERESSWQQPEYNQPAGLPKVFLQAQMSFFGIRFPCQKGLFHSTLKHFLILLGNSVNTINQLASPSFSCRLKCHFFGIRFPCYKVSFIQHLNIS